MKNNKIKGLLLASILNTISSAIAILIVYKRAPNSLFLPFVPFIFLFVFFITSRYLMKSGDTTYKTDSWTFTLLASPLIPLVYLLMVHLEIVHCSDWCGVDMLIVALPISILMFFAGLFIQIKKSYKS